MVIDTPISGVRACETRILSTQSFGFSILEHQKATKDWRELWIRLLTHFKDL